MAENKVVIKINYDKNKTGKSLSEPKMVTVWHIQRILFWAAILAILLIMLFYWLSNNHTNNTGVNSDIAAGKATTPTGMGDNNFSKPQTQPNSESSSTIGITTENYRNEAGKTTNKPQSPAAIIFDKKVIRASLNTVIKDTEPYEPLIGALKLSEHQRIPLFYFTQLKTGNNQGYNHIWSKDGKTIYKKTLPVKENKNKLISSKTFTHKDKGEWRIQLTDKTGKVFSEVIFFIDTE